MRPLRAIGRALAWLFEAYDWWTSELEADGLPPQAPHDPRVCPSCVANHRQTRCQHERCFHVSCTECTWGDGPRHDGGRSSGGNPYGH